jgi:zinc D-Ala-D-Ala carboxypeptidase
MSLAIKKEKQLNDKQLSQHFTLNEFIRSAKADQLGIDNTAPPEVLENLKQLAQCCEQVRAELDHVPMIITSGYRCSALNIAVGGVVNSSHLVGLACDFVAPKFGTSLEICQKFAQSTIAFDQLILEYVGKKNWVHVGITKRGETPRRQVLTIKNKKTRVGLWAM